jgi:hypothetical protein
VSVVSRKVDILGTAVSTRQQARFHVPDVEIWCTGADTAKVTPRFDRWFEVHNPDILNDPSVDGYDIRFANHVKWLATQDSKVFIPRASDALPDATVFPAADILNKWSSEFIRSGPSWMLAVLIHEELVLNGRHDLNHLDVRLFGIDMADEEEMRDQWDGVLHFIKLLEAFGATVLVPEGSALIRTRQPYPMCGETEIAVLLRTRLATLRHLHAHATAEHEAAVRKVEHLNAAISEIERMFRIVTR